MWDLELEQPVAFSFHRKGLILLFDLIAYLTHIELMKHILEGITCVVASSESPVLIASGDEDGEVNVSLHHAS